MMYDGWMWGNGWGWAGWVLMSVVMVLFWAARSPPSSSPSAMRAVHATPPAAPQLWAVASGGRAR